MKRFINSEFFRLCDVKKLNDVLIDLDDTILIGSDTTLPEKIVKHSTTYKPYDKLTEYVENSQGWLNLKKKIDDYYFSQEELKKLKHTKTQILDEIYPDQLSLYKHTYTVFEKYYDVYLDYPHDSENGEDYTYTFYTTGYDHEIILDVDNLLLPYYTDHHGEYKDLVKQKEPLIVYSTSH